MGNSRKTYADLWTRRIMAALDEAASERSQRRYLNKLNRQHNSIRQWETGKSATTEPTDSNGSRFQLLP